MGVGFGYLFLRFMIRMAAWDYNGGFERMNGTARENIKPGQPVLIVLKQDQRSGKLTRGVVKDILTKSPTHPHGIKVRLESGEIGRVKEIVG
jgi:uncharacterized repeat protein (TIGR03833 family)